MKSVAPGRKTCTMDGCDRQAQGRGLCKMHWARWKRHGDPNVTLRDWGTGKTAKVVSYGGAHVRVRKARGRARDHECISCGQQAAHWAYMGTDPSELAEDVEIRGRLRRLMYSTDPKHYEPMCQGCHQALDREPATHCRRGHEFTPENTIIKGRERECRACRNRRNRERYRKVGDQ